MRDQPSVRIRSARVEDAAAVALIYNAGIESRLATFETEHRTPQELAERIVGTTAPYDFLVATSTIPNDTRSAESCSDVVGWAATMAYSVRPVYAGIAEYSVYVAPDARGTGVGAALLAELLTRAGANGLHKVTSRIFPENEASLRLAERHGFRIVGTHVAHARLDGEWRDVVTVEVLLAGSPARDGYLPS